MAQKHGKSSDPLATADSVPLTQVSETNELMTQIHDA